MSGAVYRHLMYPAYHWLKRDGVNRAVAELRASQWLPGDAMRGIQQAKLEGLLRYVHRHVPYYRGVIEAIGIDPTRLARPEEFVRLPRLTKALIRDNQVTLRSTTAAPFRSRANSTSGSTGEPLTFTTDDRQSAYRKAMVIRNKEWMGWRMGDKEARLWGAPVDVRQAHSLRGRLHGAITRSLFLSAYDLTPAVMDNYISSLRRFRPVLLVSYPSILEVFAQYCRERSATFPSLRALVTSAEMLHPWQRSTIEGALGARIFNRYGCREAGDIAHECEIHDGLHVHADTVLVEIVDDAGHPCPPGEPGEILITCLEEYGMPLIRYAIGDRGSWAAAARACPCNRGLPLLSAVEGRTLDVVRTRAGLHVGGTYWTILLRSRPGFRQFQVVQDALEGIAIHYVRDKDFDAGVLDYYAARIKEKCGQDFEVRFQEQMEIARTAAGKRRLVVSRVDSARTS